jgi:hypothetical protein
MHVRVIDAYHGMEYRGNVCLGINVRARHHRARHSKKMHLRERQLRERQLRVTHVIAMHDKVKRVRSRLAMVRHAMIWNVR